MEMRRVESWLTVCRQMSGGLAGAKPGTLCPIAGRATPTAGVDSGFELVEGTQSQR
jgi:hypothetical protein